MSTVARIRFLRRLAANSGCIALLVLCAPPVPAAPYVSCPGGYIADEIEDCPPVPHHPPGGPRRGGGGSGGVLDDLLDRIGLGGLL